MLIDTHCHLDDPKYHGQNPDVITRARAAGVQRFITIGCDIATSQSARAVASANADVFFTAGVHPHEAAKAPADFREQLKAIARDPRCAGIGECGLDYYYDHSPREIQRQVFLEQISLAKEMHKALVIHVRDAWDECIDILREQNMPKEKVVIHCFTGSWAHAQQFLALGCMLSLSGIVTFKNASELALVATNTPLDRLLIETDAPYLAPVPYRGKPNEPAFLVEVMKKIATMRGISEEAIAEATGNNANKVFELPI